MPRSLRWLLALALAAPAAAQPPRAAAPAVATAVFAAGCFWCAEADFEKVPGVIDAVSGYTGGRGANPTYEQVSGGGTGHREVVQVRYDPSRVRYEQLLAVFWRNVDPFDAAGQFCDKGEQYTSAIYVADAEQRRLAEQSRAALAPPGRVAQQPIVTPVVDAAPFYEAEAYHQAYYKKNPIRYRFYRNGCRRDARLREVWGSADKR
jgi:peptide-methionine (S)-S-oxide reductase